MPIISFLQNHMLPCPSKVLLHMECPGCGLQRSFICLLQGDLKNSLAFHPATVPMLALVIFAAMHLIFNFNKGAKIIIILQFIVAFITISFYIYKITQHKIFY